MSKAAIARRASLNASGVSRSIDELCERGIIEALGTGSRRLYRLRMEHPLGAALRDLFAAESAWFQSIIDELRIVVGSLRPPPRAAWIQGPVATETDTCDDAITIGLVASARDIDRLVDEVGDVAARIEQAHDVSIEPFGLTSADLATLAEATRDELRTALPLLGPPPSALFRDDDPDRIRRTILSHDELDQRALVLAGAIAERLRNDPSIVERAREHVAQRLRVASPQERKEYREWARVLQTMSIPRLRRFLVDRSERATRLRQTLPFLGVLSEDELAALKESAR
jgi:hypothetical protein